jgi:microsomal dipeptidase-like Zn-dependent dipeptidase
MIADLHCHYPMHLLPDEHHPHRRSQDWFHRLGDELQELREDLEAEATGLLARVINNRSWGSGWRIDLDGLEDGGAGIVCSVLFWPAAEIDFGEGYGAPPEAGYYEQLQQHLEHVEDDLREQDPEGTRHVIVTRAEHLDDESRVRFVHCVEGGFHLGREGDGTIDEHVGWLAGRGVVYITLAHLFFRGVAASAPALPPLSDNNYNRFFPQKPGIGLTPLGEDAVRAMHKHKVLIDISHMRQDAIDETFRLLEELDGDDDPRDFPVIATHVGMRAEGPDDQAYNLTPDTVRAIQRRGGAIGLIMAQHQLGETHDDEDSRALLGRHIEALAEAAGGSHELTALGTDLDGFIKPTLSGVEEAADYRKLEEWIRKDYSDDADAILYGNAKRVLRKAFEGR